MNSALEAIRKYKGEPSTDPKKEKDRPLYGREFIHDEAGEVKGTPKRYKDMGQQIRPHRSGSGLRLSVDDLIKGDWTPSPNPLGEFDRTITIPANIPVGSTFEIVNNSNGDLVITPPPISLLRIYGNPLRNMTNAGKELFKKKLQESVKAISEKLRRKECF